MTARRASVAYVKFPSSPRNWHRNKLDRARTFFGPSLTAIRVFPRDLSRKVKSKTMCTLKCKKWVTYITIAFFFICGGIEYGIILPTALDYLTVHYHGPQWIFGLSISAFSISNLFAGPILGFIYDRTRAVRAIVLVANLFEIGGNFMYFAATSEWMVVGSRFIVGIGAGAGAAIFGYLAHTSTNKDRTAFFSMFMAARQIGLILGPGMNFFLQYSNFQLGPFVLDKYTAPGAFMTIVWTVLELMFVFFFFKLPIVEEHSEEKTLTVNEESVTNEGRETQASGYGAINSKPDIGDSGSTLNDSEKEESGSKQPLLGKNAPQNVPKLKKMVHIMFDLIHEETVVLLAVFTITMFNQMAIETLVVPLGEDYLGWNETYISVFYMVAGVEIIFSFAVIRFLSRKITDRWLLMFGLVCALISYTWYTATLELVHPDTKWALASFVAGGVVLIFGLPFMFVPGSSLYSKFLPSSIQGFGQGVRRSMGSIAAILGPLWAASTFPISLYITFGVILALLLLILVLTLLSFRSLKEPAAQTTRTQSPAQS